MNGTASGAVATRNGTVPAQQHQAALAIRGNQSMWDDKQRAALVAMGVSEKATNAELAVFFHQCQKTQLDPFSKQIYFIHRRVKEGDRWVEKPSTQIGIDGFRVIRDRIADKKGARVEYEDTIWYDGDRNAYDVWIDDEPPAACKLVVLVDGRRFPSVLRFNEYCQFGRADDNGNRPRTGRWRDGHAHQIEKCAEADALRKAFPNDMAGLVLEDAAPLSDPDAPAVLPQDRPRVTADEARQRRQTVTATATVVTPDVPPAQSATPPAEPAADPQQGAGGTPADEPSEDMKAARRAAQAQAKRVFGDDRETRLLWAARIIKAEDGAVKSFDHLTLKELRDVIGALSKVGNAAELEEFLATGTVPRGE